MKKAALKTIFTENTAKQPWSWRTRIITPVPQCPWCHFLNHGRVPIIPGILSSQGRAWTYKYQRWDYCRLSQFQRKTLQKFCLDSLSSTLHRGESLVIIVIGDIDGTMWSVILGRRVMELTRCPNKHLVQFFQRRNQTHPRISNHVFSILIVPN